MANEEHVALLKQGVAVWNAWRPTPISAQTSRTLTSSTATSPTQTSTVRTSPARAVPTLGHGPAFSRR